MLFNLNAASMLRGFQLKIRVHRLFFLVAGLLSSALNAQTPKDTPAIIEDALSSVVTVAVYKSEFTKSMLGMRGNSDDAYAKHLDLTNAQGSGSGFVIQNQGKYYVVTNAHVVETASNENEAIYVYSISRNKYEVKIKGGDSFYDFAILEFVSQPGKEITTLAFSKTEPRIGEPVFAIGNPLGEYPYTVSDGIISAKNRARGGITGKFGFIQSTATVIWGNSGGPLINAKGEVVGINSQIAFADDGGSGLWLPQINFALESAVCRRLTDDIFQHNGIIQRAYLGIEASQLYRVDRNPYTDETSAQLIDPLPRLSGFTRGSPAAAVLSDALLGSVIREVNNVEVRNLNELLGEFENVKPGAEISLTLENGNTIKEVKIKSELLKTSHLESLARDIFAKDPNLQFDVTAQGIDFSVRQSEPRPNRRYKNTISQSGENFKGSLVGLGHLSQENATVWRINTLGEAGAVLRLFGVTGYCQLALSSEYSASNDPALYPLVFSGREGEVKSVVWY
jgi:S1-C subfamily serine protease